MHVYIGVMHGIYYNYAKLGCWGPIFVSNYDHRSNEIVLSEWYEIGVCFRFDCCYFARKLVPKPAIPTQASWTHLGESSRV